MFLCNKTLILINVYFSCNRSNPCNDRCNFFYPTLSRDVNLISLQHLFRPVLFIRHISNFFFLKKNSHFSGYSPFLKFKKKKKNGPFKIIGWGKVSSWDCQCQVGAQVHEGLQFKCYRYVRLIPEIILHATKYILYEDLRINSLLMLSFSLSLLLALLLNISYAYWYLMSVNLQNNRCTENFDIVSW